MRTHSNRYRGWPHGILAAALILFGLSTARAQQPLVPGTGTLLPDVGDDFEDDGWEYVYNHPKSTYENDDQQRYPAGAAKNGRWYEGMKRGQPDVIQRVSTPQGGLPGSTGALLLRTLSSGIPGRPSYRMQQDDFVADVSSRMGGAIPIARSPSVVVRVFLPPVATWEKRTGPHFAFRADVETTVMKPSGKSRFAGTHQENETYWPGLFVEFESKADGADNNYAYISIRANEWGHNFRGPQITTTGWWTLGMSFTPDGRVHYFGKPGVEDLTAADHIATQYPYGYRCERFQTFFFDLWNNDDGRTSSTSFVIDDPQMYVMPESAPIREAQVPKRRS